MGGLGAAVSVSVGRSYAVQERGGGRVTPCVFLLHVLLDVVLYDVAVVVSLHRGGATGAQVTQREPWRLTADWVQTVVISWWKKRKKEVDTKEAFLLSAKIGKI